MPFPQIAEALGISPQGAQHIYQRAMRKIRSNPVEVRKLAELIRAKEMARESRFS